MNKPRRSSRSLVAVVALGFALVAFAPSSAWAQPPKGSKKEPTPEELKGYTMPYFFTAVGVLAVTMSICWPANRKWDIKLTGEED